MGSEFHKWDHRFLLNTGTHTHHDIDEFINTFASPEEPDITSLWTDSGTFIWPNDNSALKIYDSTIAFAAEQVITDYGSQPGLGAQANTKRFIDYHIDDSALAMTSKSYSIQPIRASVYHKTKGIANVFNAYMVMDTAETLSEGACYYGFTHLKAAGAGLDPLVAVVDWWLNVDVDNPAIGEIISYNSKVASPTNFKAFAFWKQDTDASYNGPLTRGHWIRANCTQGMFWLENVAEKPIFVVGTEDIVNWKKGFAFVYSGDDVDRYLRLYRTDGATGDGHVDVHKKSGDTGGRLYLNYFQGGDLIYGGGSSSIKWQIRTDGVMNLISGGTPSTNGDLWWDGTHYYGRTGGANVRLDTYVTYARSATKVIAAYNSLDTANADYVCDGTNDEVQIQAAFDSLTSGKGRIVFLEGDFNIAAKITGKDNISIEGLYSGGFPSNTGGTNFNLVANCTMFDFTDKRDWSFKNVRFEGNSRSGYPIILGVYDSAMCNHFQFIDCGFYHCIPAMRFTKAYDASFVRCKFGHCGDASYGAVECHTGTTGSNYCDEFKFDHCHWEQLPGIGVKNIDDTGTAFNANFKFTVCKFEGGTGAEKSAISGALSATLIQGCSVTQSTANPAVYLTGEGNRIIGNYFYGCSVYGVQISGAYNLIEGNRFAGCTPTADIRIDATGWHNKIIGNSGNGTTGTTIISDAGDSTILAHNTLTDNHSSYLLVADIDDTPVDGVTNAPISSNWAYDHAAAADPHTGYRLESADHTHATTGVEGGTIDHGALTGRTDDDHSAYPLLIGRSGGQSLYGSTVNDENLNLYSTSGTGGYIVHHDQCKFYDALEINNNKGIWWVDTGATAREILTLNASNQVIIGNSGLASGSIYMVVDGTVRQITCGANDSAVAGYRHLMVPNA